MIAVGEGHQRRCGGEFTTQSWCSNSENWSVLFSKELKKNKCENSCVEIRTV